VASRHVCTVRGHEATVWVRHDRLNDETYVSAFDYSTKESVRAHILGFGSMSLDTLCLVALFLGTIYPGTQSHIRDKETSASPLQHTKNSQRIAYYCNFFLVILHYEFANKGLAKIVELCQ